MNLILNIQILSYKFILRHFYVYIILIFYCFQVENIWQRHPLEEARQFFRFTPVNIMLTSVFVVMLTLSTIPFCKEMSTLAINLALMGLSIGLIDTAGNLSMIKMFHFDVAPFLQVLKNFVGIIH